MTELQSRFKKSERTYEKEVQIILVFCVSALSLLINENIKVPSRINAVTSAVSRDWNPKFKPRK